MLHGPAMARIGIAPVMLLVTQTVFIGLLVASIVTWTVWLAKALELKPGYPEALEYRGEAFLALNRISDAQQAYLDLFAANRGLADKLLSAMKG